MGLFTNSWKELKWGNIFIAIVLGVIGIFAYTYFATGTGIQQGPILEQIKSFFFEGTGLLRNILVVVIAMLPIIIYGHLGFFDKAGAYLWAISIGMLMFLFGVADWTIINSVYLAWVVNAISLIAMAIGSTTDGKESALGTTGAWLLFGVTSIFIAPFGSVATDNPQELWILTGILGSLITMLVQHTRIKDYLKSTALGNFLNTKEDETKSEAEDILSEIEDTEEEVKGASRAEKVTTNIATVLASGKTEEIPAFTNELQKMFAASTIFKPTETTEHSLLLKVFEQMLKSQEETTRRLFELLQDKDKFVKTEVGRAQNYIYELGGRFLRDMKNPTSRWEEFEKLRNSRFSEVVEKLRATKNTRLLGYAHFLEKNHQKIPIKTFVALTVRWIRELNNEREKLGETVERDLKMLEVNGKTIRAIAEQIDGQFREITEQKETTRKFDLKARGYYSEMLKQIGELNKVEVDRATKTEIIGSMREKLKWIVDGLANKQRTFNELKKNLNEIDSLLGKSRQFVIQNGKTMKELEKVEEEVGAGLHLAPAGA